jgi:hypothetical protein
MRKILTILIDASLTISAFGQVDTIQQSKELVVKFKVLNKTQIRITVNNISKNLIKVYSL